MLITDNAFHKIRHILWLLEFSASLPPSPKKDNCQDYSKGRKILDSTLITSSANGEIIKKKSKNQFLSLSLCLSLLLSSLLLLSSPVLPCPLSRSIFSKYIINNLFKKASLNHQLSLGCPESKGLFLKTPYPTPATTKQILSKWPPSWVLILPLPLANHLTLSKSFICPLGLSFLTCKIEG